MWITTLKKLATHKHTRLVPQKIAPPQPQLRFRARPGERVAGQISKVQVEMKDIPGLGRVPVKLNLEGGMLNPETGEYEQPLLDEIGKLTPWFPLEIEGYGEDAVEFCDLAWQRVRKIVESLERFFWASGRRPAFERQPSLPLFQRRSDSRSPLQAVVEHRGGLEGDSDDGRARSADRGRSSGRGRRRPQPSS